MFSPAGWTFHCVSWLGGIMHIGSSDGESYLSTEETKPAEDGKSIFIYLFIFFSISKKKHFGNPEVANSKGQTDWMFVHYLWLKQKQTTVFILNVTSQVPCQHTAFFSPLRSGKTEIKQPEGVLLFQTHFNTWSLDAMVWCSAKDQKLTRLFDSLEANCVDLQALKVSQETDWSDLWGLRHLAASTSRVSTRSSSTWCSQTRWGQQRRFPPITLVASERRCEAVCFQSRSVSAGSKAQWHQPWTQMKARWDAAKSVAARD